MNAVARVQCPLPHSPNRNFEVVPLEDCRLCKGTGLWEPDEEAVSRVVIDGRDVWSRETALGRAWFCTCGEFKSSEARETPGWCKHTVRAPLLTQQFCR